MGFANAAAAEKFDTDAKHQLPRPDTKAPDTKKPVKVFILMGQSNMVGMGKITGGRGIPGKRGQEKEEIPLPRG